MLCHNLLRLVATEKKETKKMTSLCSSFFVCLECKNGRAQQIGNLIVCHACGSKFRLVKIKEVVKHTVQKKKGMESKPKK